ncbi:sodium-dependent transporter [Halomonas sp. MCCC 1A11036]|uniref:Sodium-dependent transporter n=1 Tax=Billgrantia zhangzhouensis TaxID=2733481 RepID=A0ABS9A9S7_9GAMM|nr:sodium-dependent transporter [Halomonas zhangzhouensis]MCE8018675.1 sodium-dependent transporter [Halomonas zhangzhouensis]
MSKLVHAQWSSKMTFVLAAAGSAVGLGNIWRFSYMVGDSGGAAFVLVYLACVAVVGLPILVAEWLIGRRGQKNPINAMAELAKANGQPKAWALIGVSGVLAAFLILSFYSVIGGWSLSYTLNSVTGTFTGQDADGVGAIFTGLLGSPGLLLLWHTAFMALVVWIVARGVTKGLEGAVRTMMPALVVLLVVLVGYGMTTGHFGEALAFMFRPDWSALTGGVVLAAMGQAFFTLSLGMGIMMAYGSYLGEDVNLLGTARTVIILDTTIALLAGLAIFPIVFANGLSAGEGPGLIFVTLPLAFGNMTGGMLLGLMFFLLLTFAALTSAISLLEPVVEFVEERTPLTRVMAALVSAVAVWLLGIAALMSFNVWPEPVMFGLNVFDLLDTFTSKILLPLTGLGAIVFVAWCLDRRSVAAELNLSGSTEQLWQLVARYLAPLGVILVFVNSLLG